METVHEGGSEDSLEEVNLSDDVRVDLHNDTGSGYDSGLRGLVVNTDDPGQANFVMSVGALGNASRTPLDGSQDVSFSKSTVNGEFTIDGGEDTAPIMQAYNVPTAYNQNDLNGVNSTIVDPEMVGALMSRCSVVDPRSPTSTVQFNNQFAVQHYALGSPASTSETNPTTSAGNTGGAEPSSSPQSDPTSSHGGTPSSQPLGDANTGNSPSSTGLNGNNGNQRSTNNSNGPQGPTPDRNYLNKLVFTYSTTGGPLQHWGIEGRIRAGDVVHFTGPDTNLRL